MKPVILFYNVSPSKINILRPVLSMMGVGLKFIEDEQMNCTVGALAYPDLFKGDCEQSDNETQLDSFDEEFMLLCGFDRVSLDKILNFMKKKKISISLKAMMTETNKDWCIAKLISEIKSERDEIARAISERGAGL